jgi:hypothetical protein
MAETVLHSALSNPRPISGWALAKLIVIDEHAPGALRRTMEFSAHRRQVIFSALAFLDLSRRDDLAYRL